MLQVCLCFSLLSLVTVNDVCAQKDALTWSEPSKLSNNEVYRGISGHDNDGFYAVRLIDNNESTILLERYDLQKMDKKFSKQVNMPVVGTKANKFEILMHMGSGFLLFSSVENKSSGKFEIYCSALDRQGEQVVKPVMVHFLPHENYRNGTKLDVRLSPDSSKFMVFFISPFERKAKETFQLRVYTTDFDLLWQKDLELPYQQNVVQVRNYMLNNKGDVFLMSGWAPEKNAGINRFQRPQDGRYVLFHYNWEENKLKEFDVSLKDKSIVSVIPAFAPNGDVVIGGFYSNDYLFSVAGTFLFVLNPLTDQVKAATMVPFTKEFLAQFINERAIEKGNDLSDFYLDHLHIEPNGEVIMLGERFYITERIISDPSSGRQTVEYLRNFDDIIVVKLDAEGYRKWNCKIAKRQSASDLGNFLSYAYFANSEGLRLFFNDNAENVKLLNDNPQATPRSYSGGRNSIASEVTVKRSDGSQQREQVSSQKETSFQLRPSLCYDYPQGPVILGFQEGRNMKYAVLRK